MAVNSDAMIVPGHGTIFHAAPNTPAPATPLTAFTLMGTPPTDWSTFGHTSKQNVVQFNREGGETTPLDTYLVDGVRTVQTGSTTWTLVLNALQMEHDTLDIAFNGDWDTTGDRYLIPANASPVKRALFVLLSDNSGAAGFYIPNAELGASGAPTIDPAQFLEFPITATLLAADEAALPLVEGKASIMAAYKTGLVDPVVTP